MNKKITLSVALILLAVMLLACQVTSLIPTPAGAPILTPTISTVEPSTVNLVNQQEKLVALYQAVNPGVVTVQTASALGSGWVYNTDGYIVTNQHIVGTDTKAEVDFTTGFKIYGNVVGTDLNSDLAVIKVDAPADQLHPLPLGDSDALKVGQIAIAIGDPLTLNGTLTTGVISGLGRSEASNAQAGGGAYYVAADFIETDALLNHGNSGGPLLNLDGQVIGVNRSIQVDPTTGLPSGLGYAISINIVKRVVPSLIQTGKYNYPLLGASAVDNLPLTVVDALGLKSNTGAYVTSVATGGPAAAAGLRAGSTPLTLQGYTSLNSGGDLIIAADGNQIFTYDALTRYLALHKSPGDTVVLTVLRGDQKMDLTITLGTRP